EDSDFKDSIDQSVLTHCHDLFVDPTPEMFTDEQPPDYSFPSRFDDFFRDDVLPSPDNEDKVFNPRILSREKLVTHVTQEKKLAVSYASCIPEFMKILANGFHYLKSSLSPLFNLGIT
nr:hypothetical protein [Tanacetum cinerariifolium]